MGSDRLERLPRRDENDRIPRSLGDGLFEVDATWGTIQPLQLAPGVRTVAELEVIEHLQRGGPLVDTRLEEHHRRATLPGATWICHKEVLEHRAQLDPSTPTVFFCNGPQCLATPDAVRVLLDHGYPPSGILYYRGGIHDWMTLGLPIEIPDPIHRSGC